jgi:hypothetical protein
VRALNLVPTRLINPAIRIGDHEGVFPVEMESGSYLECNSPDDCKVFGPDGGFLQDVKIAGEIPALAAGDNRLHFGCESALGVNPRVRITTSTFGAPFGP